MNPARKKTEKLEFCDYLRKMMKVIRTNIYFNKVYFGFLVFGNKFGRVDKSD